MTHHSESNTPLGTTRSATVIVGLGSTGLSVARFLFAQKKLFMVMDTRVNPPGLSEFVHLYPNSTVVTGHLDSDWLLQADEIVLSPGISLKESQIQLAINAGVNVIGDIELFARAARAPVVAITGSNAKTTVTALVGKMAENANVNVAVGGNIGTPALDILSDTAELYVLELSSFQLETTHSLSAAAATILNVSDDHMDRYGSLLEYQQAKQRIYRYADTVVYNRDDACTQPSALSDKGALSFGIEQQSPNDFSLVYQSSEIFLAHGSRLLLNTRQLALQGQHNHLNCLAALALGMAVNLPIAGMLDTLTSFEGLPHRCQFVGAIDGVRYINDSKATNVGATLAALNGLAENTRNIILIAGGQAKGADFSPLRAGLEAYVRCLILIGCDAERLVVVDDMTAIQHANTLNEAVILAKRQSKTGDIVLLSPACASFDMFSGYEDRGNQFIAAVNQVTT